MRKIDTEVLVIGGGATGTGVVRDLALRGFKAILVDKDEYLLQLSRYIHLNPVRAKVVKKPKDYPWTSYRFFLKGQNDSLVNTADTLCHFAGNLKRARRNYQAFVEGSAGLENPFQNLKQGILGDEQFVEEARAHVDPSLFSEEIPRTQRPIKEMGLGKVLETVAAFYGKDRQEITRRGKGKPEREVAVYVAKAVTGKTNKEIGIIFGIKGSSVSEIVKRVERRLDKDVQLRREIGTLKDSN